MVAAQLDFDDVSANSLDGVSDRDFCIELAAALSLVMVHLSRFSEEIIMWCSWEFKFVELDDAFSTAVPARQKFMQNCWSSAKPTMWRQKIKTIKKRTLRSNDCKVRFHLPFVMLFSTSLLRCRSVASDLSRCTVPSALSRLSRRWGRG